MNNRFDDLQVDIKKEHIEIISSLLEPLQNVEIKNVLDAGSGKTSLTLLTHYYEWKVIDAIIFPGDKRKKESIALNVPSHNYNLIELDICKDRLEKQYDLVVAHLLLGEAIKFGNTFSNLFNKLMSINSRYFIIIDYMEDIDVDFNYIENYLHTNNMKIIKESVVTLKNENSYDSFIGKNYKGYLIEKMRVI